MNLTDHFCGPSPLRVTHKPKLQLLMKNKTLVNIREDWWIQHDNQQPEIPWQPQRPLNNKQVGDHNKVNEGSIKTESILIGP